jgi:hypothetical protein
VARSNFGNITQICVVNGHLQGCMHIGTNNLLIQLKVNGQTVYVLWSVHRHISISEVSGR